MSFSTQKKSKAISEINVTPLVDVMLVLLVIFMISAPLLYNGVQLQLPKTEKNSSVQLKKDQIVVSYTRGEKLFFGEDEVGQDALLKRLAEAMKGNSNQTVFLRADNELKYGLVASLLSFLRKKGITQIALVTEGQLKK